MAIERASLFILLISSLVLLSCGSDGVVVKNAYMRGVDLYDDGDYHEAIREYQAALADNPEDYRVWYNLGLCYHEIALAAPEGERASWRGMAEEAYGRSEAIEAGRSRARLARARLLWDLGDRAEAIAALEGFEGDESIGRGAPAMTLGSMYFADNRIAEAESELRRALALEEGYRPAQCALASLLIDQDRGDEARPLLEAAIAKHPYDLTLRVLEARLLEKEAERQPAEEKWRAALASWEQAEAFAVGDWEVAAGIARACAELGETERAVRNYWFARDKASDRALSKRGYDPAAWRSEVEGRLRSLYPRLGASAGS